MRLKLREEEFGKVKVISAIICSAATGTIDHWTIIELTLPDKVKLGGGGGAQLTNKKN